MVSSLISTARPIQIASDHDSYRPSLQAESNTDVFAMYLKSQL